MVSRRVGGAALVAMALARAATKRGWSNRTWVPGPGPAADALARENLPHHVIGLETTDPSTVRRLMTCGRLTVGLVGKSRPVVHVHGTWMFGLIRPALRTVNARTLVHFQLDPDSREIDWVLKRPPAHLITCAQYIGRRVRSEVEQRGLPTEVTAIPNAVDLTRFAPGDRMAAREALGLDAPDRFVILMLANLAPHKGQATAIRALHALTRRGVQATLWIAGEDRTGTGTYEQSLRQLAADLGVVSHVRFLGLRSDTPQLLHAANVFLLPSTHEGLPISVLEAQAAGVPVVGSDIPGMLEVIEDGVTGFAVRADDAEGCADRLFSLYQDAGLVRRVIEAASRRVQREHSWKVFEDRTFGLYAALGERSS
jgi:glycosyltransferase involved in cell wall biosynthesis